MNDLLSRLIGGNPEILVAGDLILDRYVWGEVDRISPEAPVQVLRWEREEETLGGAANVAQNLASLGCSVRLMGLLGEDEEGDRLEALARQAGMDVGLIRRHPGRPTVSKTRFIGRNQQILRVDREEAPPHSPEAEKEMSAQLPEALGAAAGVICSDYLKGALTPAFMEKLVAAAGERGLPVITDPKGADYTKYRGVTALTPNLAEVAQATGVTLDSEEAIDRAARAMYEELAPEFILVTRGAGGMTLYGKEGRLSSEASNALEVYDVTGAGDTAAALFGLALVQEIPAADAARIANLGAGIVVGKVGAAPLDPGELESALSGEGKQKIFSRPGLEKRLQTDRARGREVVFTNGCFDLMHVGHIQYLQQAKELGDILVIGLNDDASVRRVKGEGRPLIEERQRAQLLAALGCVDYVVFFPEDTPEELIRAVRPDILVKGGDYAPEEVVGREQVESSGGRVEVLPFVDGVSTTRIVNTIIERYSGDKYQA